MVTRHEYTTASPELNSNSIINDALVLSSIGSSNRPNIPNNIGVLTSENGGRTNENRRQLKLSFPLKLMSLLDSHEHDDTISWDGNGKSFTVHDPKTLVVKVIPKYFKASSFPSFKRKLYRWGFTKLYTNDYSNVSTPFFHKKFIRGNYTLCKEISCSVSKDLKPSSENKPKIIQPVNRNTGSHIPHGGIDSHLLHVPPSSVTSHVTNHRQPMTSSCPDARVYGFTGHQTELNPSFVQKDRGTVATPFHHHVTNSFPPYPRVPKPMEISRSFSHITEITDRPTVALESESDRHFRMLQLRSELYWNNRMMIAPTYDSSINRSTGQSLMPSQASKLQNCQELMWQRRHYNA